jgi:hypothetical protein
MTLIVTKLRTYLREPEADEAALLQITELVNGLVDEFGPYPDPEPAKVYLIRLNAAARAWRNPRGLTSYTEGIDDHTETWRFDRTTPGGGVYLTDAEERDLRDIAAGVVPVDAVAWSGSMPYRR